MRAIIEVLGARPDGSRDVTVRFPLGPGQTLRVEDSIFVEGGPSSVGGIGISQGRRWHRRRWWEWLLRRPRRPVMAHVVIRNNVIRGAS